MGIWMGATWVQASARDNMKVEIPKAVNDHYSVAHLTRGKVVLVWTPKWAIGKLVHYYMGCNDWPDRCCFTPLAITFGRH